MNEREFHEKADKVFLAIEQWVEEIDKDIDIESQEGILTLTLPQGNQVLLSCQTALNELWLASKLGAFHFKYIEDSWVTPQGQLLPEVLCQLFEQPIDEAVDLNNED